MHRSGSGSETGEDGRELNCLIRGDQGSETGEDGRKLRCFGEFEVFPTLWDEWNPCQIYIMGMR